MRGNQSLMQRKGKRRRRVINLKKSMPLTLMALPGILLMAIFKYLPMSGIILAFKRFNVREGIFGSRFIGWENFKFLFRSSDAWIITRNTLLYNLAFIALDVIFAVTFAIILNELLHKKRAKLFQSIYIAPYFLSWVAVSFVAYAFLSTDNGLLNHLLSSFGKEPVSWYVQSKWWPLIIIVFEVWKTVGYSTVMYMGALTGIPNDYYEAALVDGATKWQQIRHITIPCLKTMMLVLVTLAIGRIFFSDFGLFYQLPRNSGPLFSTTNVIDTYIYRALKETGDIGMSAAANLYQSVVGFVMVVAVNFIIRRVDKESALF
ncbi:MAG: ABC transporter permease subunit [Lachnospiraceae bacterium]|nr:ABC transporter permease subunit [Lachnospiraceae bacterium]MDD7026054.1 ABC transporter permease subunit [Lachnospiraceae bacterium]MDY5700018.1 ABC transporter permease subunit [Lachnospiraceae bacterium]